MTALKNLHATKLDSMASIMALIILLGSWVTALAQGSDEGEVAEEIGLVS